MSDSDHNALIQTLRQIESEDFNDMVACWESAVNDLHDAAMGNNTINEIKRAFDEMRKCPNLTDETKGLNEFLENQGWTCKCGWSGISYYCKNCKGYKKGFEHEGEVTDLAK